MLSARRHAAKMSERSTTVLQLQARGWSVCHDILDKESDHGLKASFHFGAWRILFTTRFCKLVLSRFQPFLGNAWSQRIEVLTQRISKRIWNPERCFFGLPELCGTRALCLCARFWYCSVVVWRQPIWCIASTYALTSKNTRCRV